MGLQGLYKLCVTSIHFPLHIFLTQVSESSLPQQYGNVSFSVIS